MEVFQQMSEDFRFTSCPECGQSTLIRLVGAGLPPIIKGTETPCRGRKKTKRKDRLGMGKYKGEEPFWRNGPINKKILKNPEKYIKKGETDG